MRSKPVKMIKTFNFSEGTETKKFLSPKIWDYILHWIELLKDLRYDEGFDEVPIRHLGKGFRETTEEFSVKIIRPDHEMEWEHDKWTNVLI